MWQCALPGAAVQKCINLDFTAIRKIRLQFAGMCSDSLALVCVLAISLDRRRDLIARASNNNDD